MLLNFLSFFWFPFRVMFVITYPLPVIRREVPRNVWLTKFFVRLANAAARQTAGYQVLKKCRNPNVAERAVGKNLAKGVGKMQDRRT
jgi:hypothetical protein